MTDPRATLPQPTLAPNTLLGGKYRIVELLGQGGVGFVYRAHHEELGIDVAIKTLRPEMANRPDIVKRFAREAKASVRLESEHIAKVYDVGTHEDAPYFVMEYLVGSDLGARAAQGGLGVQKACELVIQACEGLAVAHARGIVHRDIKPENLFVVRQDSGWEVLKILDFGISKVSLAGQITDYNLGSVRTEVMMGTPLYMSPEQIRSSKDVDHRTDIWSLGVVLFEILTGKMPFREEHEMTRLVAEILELPHTPLLDVGSGLPPELGDVIDGCLEKDRETRFPTAAALARALLPFAPKRARASVERASAATRSSGSPGPWESSEEISSTLPPSQKVPPVVIPPAARAPLIATPPPASSVAPVETPPPTTSVSPVETPPPQSPAVVPTPMPPAAATKRNVVPYVLLGVAAIVIVLLLLRQKSTEVPRAGASTGPGTVSAPLAPVAEIPSVRATTTAAPIATTTEAPKAAADASAPAPPTGAAPVVPHRPTGPIGRPVAPPPTTRPTTAAPAASPLEIRHER